jgi:penicillin-binding protein 1C
MGSRAILRSAFAVALSLFLFFAGIEAAARLLPPPSLKRFSETSQLVLDSNGSLLRAFLTSDQKWRLGAQAADVPKLYLDLLIAYEDRRFFAHSGIDRWALFRSVWQLVRHGRAVSGGSTLSMQVARLLLQDTHGIGAKIRQLIAARQLERRYTKAQILSMYLTLAPFGGNIEGIRAASLIYFEKEPKSLSDAEASMLIAVPQAPEARRPDLWIGKTLSARRRVIERAQAAGVLTETQAGAIGSSPIKASRNGMIFLASHAAEIAHRRFPDRPAVRTTLDASLQAGVEQIARDFAREDLAHVSMAILVVRNRDMAVRAYLSGSSFFSEANAGQVDLITAIRSPGSALKPFIYGLAFEKLVAHPLTIVFDAPTRFGAYEPKNFSEEYQGEVTVRDALIRSVNTTAVTILSKVGPDRFMTRLHQAGVDLKVEGTDLDAGLAIALGGCGTSLWDLSRLYAALANRGQIRDLKLFDGDALAPPAKLLTPEAAWAVTDILADALPPDGFTQKPTTGGGRRIAYKTGTSYNFRDAWAAGFDRLHTVIVWTGRPDGAPNPGATGRHAAAPALFQVFDLLPEPEADVAGTAPPGTILSQRNNLPERLERLSMQPAYAPSQPLKITFPPEGSRLILGTEADGSPSAVAVQVKGGTSPYLFYVNDVLVAQTSDRSSLRWKPPGKGQFQARVVDGAGRVSAVSVWIE